MNKLLSREKLIIGAICFVFGLMVAFSAKPIWNQVRSLTRRTSTPNILTMAQTGNSKANAQDKDKESAAVSPSNAIPNEAVLWISEFTIERNPDADFDPNLLVRASIKKRDNAVIDNTKAAIQVYFYDTLPNNQIKRTDADVSYKWLTPNRDWTDRSGTEILAISCVRNKNKYSLSEQAARKYLGFVFRVYYGDKLQDARSEPEKLAKLFPPALPGPLDANRMFEETVKEDDARAQIALGLMYESGHGVPRDFHKAFVLYEQAAKQGNAIGEAYLASAFAVGEGVSPDYVKARDLYQKAVDQTGWQEPACLGEFAWFLASCPEDSQRNGKLAVVYAEYACKLTKWEDREFIDTLAAAYAETGEIERAINYEEEAMNTDGNYPDRQQMEKALDLFLEGKPYRAHLLNPK